LIGLLNGRSRDSSAQLRAAFRQGLAALGLNEGSQVVIEERWADGEPERLSALAAELGAKRPAIIVADSTPSARAATKAMPRTPIVVIGGNPVAAGWRQALHVPAA
jgi:putative ABC transport system substrate-binding protein